MKEIILSTYLLFGQSKNARKVLHPKDAFPDTPKPYHDPLLHTLCCEEWKFPNSPIKPKKFYNPKNEFPVLWPKLNVLREMTDEARPTGLRQLWRGSENTNQWYTFWAALIFGCFSLLLAIVQIALSAAQLYYSMGQNMTSNKE